LDLIRDELLTTIAYFMARRLHKWIASTKQTLMNHQFESTYALLVRSEKKSRNVLEILLYAIFLISVVVGIWQFAQTPVRISAPGIEPCVVCHTSTTQLPTGS
jgi:hypothetical protein